MRPALLVLAYGLGVAWWTPVLLARLTADGISARLGLAAWVAAMASVLACGVMAVRFVVDEAVTNWS